MERQKGERCGIDNCRSRYYHLEDGQWTCSNGHVQEGRLDIREDDEYQPRKGDRRVVETDDAGTVPEKVFTGRKGLSLFLQAYQLILRKQVSWFINEKNFPPEFQLLVRDLWTLRLEAIYSDRSSRAPSSSGYTSAASQASQSEAGSERNYVATTTATATTTTPSQSGGISDTASQMSTSAMSLSTSQSRSSRGRRRRKTRDYEKTTPKLIDSICICYLAAILLHLPLDISTVHKWIVEQDVIYFRAIAHIPLEMVGKMETKWNRKFEPKGMPTAESLRRSIYHHLRYYHKRFDIVIPRMNAEKLLVGYILEFGCPPETYPAVFNLANMMDITFQFPAGAQNLNLVDNPDLQIIALLVISVKLCYSLDNVRRHAKDESEIANMVPDWETWKDIIQMKELDINPKDFEGGASRSRNWQLGADEDEIYQFTDKEMDEYLDWFERNLAGDGNSEGKPTAPIIKLFEDDTDPEKAPNIAEDVSDKKKLSEERIKAFIKMQKLAKIGNPISDLIKEKMTERRILRPGEKYQRYRRWEDITSDKIRVLYTAAAEKMAVKREEFAYVVQKLEYRIGKLAKGDIKAGDVDMDDDSEEEQEQEREEGMEDEPVTSEEEPVEWEDDDEDEQL